MLSEATLAEFQPHLGKVFRIRDTDGRIIETRLIEARELPFRRRAPGAGRQPFSLLFESTAPAELPQRIYTIEQASLGMLDVFLVPIGRHPNGTRLEAIFS